MIRYLAIRNLAVIESVAVEFEQSFNVLTGETGAGKSILVEAVGLLLGGRASQELVRTGEEVATVEAIFETPSGAEVTVRREVTAQGRSRGFIDGALATAGQLRERMATLIELHGQHEHQALVDPESHVPLLDNWAGLETQYQQVAQAWTRVRDLRGQIERMRRDDRERAARLELLAFQLGELQKAALKEGEDEALQELRQVLRSADLVQRLCAEGYADLYDSEQSVLTGLGRVWKRVGELAAIDGVFAGFLDGRDAIKAQLEDLALTLRDYGDRVDLSPGRLQEVEDRLALVERLKRKHGPTLSETLSRQGALEAEQLALRGGAGSLTTLEALLRDASTAFLETASALSMSRHAAAPRFARALEGELSELAMDRTRFAVRLARDEDEAPWSERGIDRGEFYLSPNPGEDLRPLARIASGGELSRIMLALKTLAAADQTGKTLIFDEVDAGIGGRVASAVGERLRRLGTRFQVLCITHLPPIAACGGTHFRIEKDVRGTRTVTSVSRLDEPGRVEEVARMIGGAAITDQVRASARDLLARAPSPGGESGRQAKAKGESPRGAKAKAR